MPFPYSIRTSVCCASASSLDSALAAVAESLKHAGAAVSERPDGSLAFCPGNRLFGRRWLSGVTDGRISAYVSAPGVVVTAEATYLLPLVIGTLAAIPIGFLAGPIIAGAVWAWLVGGNYLFALLAIRWHLKKANTVLVSAAT